ncbi:serine/threonine protein phosphatase [Flavobacterium jejuense]|uniref:Serine/threonine protein phosphatase n=1 Tax=Flavobacterium jejuense TaxID=1544455 RepID=A0ABX0IRK2_9FLAO|nr:metallophosphoesterase family protein [Flavobacterium jejuense]NHN25482.1 serine/threonine protein phosphatase [Flavobacterium jejuense]
MKTFVVGDIHGGLKGLKQVISKAGIVASDRLIFLGDYVDGWSQSDKVIDFLITLKKTHNCIFLTGNHDDLLLKYLNTKKHNEEWYKHGGQSTIDAYKKVDEKTIKKHITFLNSLKPYYIDEKNRLFIHAGFTNLKGVDFEYFRPLFYWDRTLWECALALDKTLKIESIYYPSRLKLYNEIYIGHTPVTRINKTTPHNAANVWNIDTGAAFKGPLTILNVETKKYWQSNPLHELYPEEKGRN